MNKSLLTIAAALVAATTMFASAAEAGFKVRLGFGGPLPYFTAYNNSGSYGRKCSKHAYRAVRREERAPVRLTKKSASETNVASIEQKPETTAQVADTENSSISPTGVTVAEANDRRAEDNRARKAGCGRQRGRLQEILPLRRYDAFGALRVNPRSRPEGPQKPLFQRSTRSRSQDRDRRVWSENF